MGPGRSALKLARERQLSLELSAQIVRAGPKLILYVILYASDDTRLRQLRCATNAIAFTANSFLPGTSPPTRSQFGWKGEAQWNLGRFARGWTPMILVPTETLVSPFPDRPRNEAPTE